MENNLYLLSQILELSSADIKEIIDSEMEACKLNFSDRESLQKCFKLEKAIISKVEALKRLISETSFGKLLKRKKIKSSEIVVEYLRPIFHMSPIEYLIVLFLNNGNAVVDQIEIKGSLDEVKMDYQLVKPPKIEPVESSYSEIQKRKQKKEERYIRETNGVGLNYILGEKFRS